MSDTITTYTKLHINPSQCEPNMISPEDIAHSLSLLCRANGHYPRFYSVAQHCIDCILEAKARHLSKRLQLAALLHDSAEAYFSDIPKPVKKNFPELIAFEKRILSTIYTKFLGSDLTEAEQAIIDDIDHTLFCHEFLTVMGEQPTDTMPKIYSSPSFKTRPAIEIEEEYKRYFKKCLVVKNGK